MTIGEFLRSVRISQDLSLRAVEQLTNREVSNPYLSQIESGKIQKPSIVTLRALCDAYDLDLDTLLNRFYGANKSDTVVIDKKLLLHIIREIGVLSKSISNLEKLVLSLDVYE